MTSAETLLSVLQSTVKEYWRTAYQRSLPAGVTECFFSFFQATSVQA